MATAFASWLPRVGGETLRTDESRWVDCNPRSERWLWVGAVLRLAVIGGGVVLIVSPSHHAAWILMGAIGLDLTNIELHRRIGTPSAQEQAHVCPPSARDLPMRGKVWVST